MTGPPIPELDVVLARTVRPDQCPPFDHRGSDRFGQVVVAGRAPRPGNTDHLGMLRSRGHTC